MKSEDVGEKLNKYFALIVTKEMDMKVRDHCGSTKILRHFEIKKELLLGFLKSIKVDVPRA